MEANSSARREPAHIPALDGIRAIAVMLVLMVHSDMFLYNGFAAEGASSLLALRRISGIGWTGVDLFFVLSGMLITGILLDTRGGEGYFRSFYLRRTLRIFPLYYTALIVITIIIPHLGHGLLHDSVQPRSGEWSLWFYLTNIPPVRVEDWGVLSPLETHFWSLAVEEQFYLIWPFLVWWLSRKALTKVTIALIIAPVLLRVVLTHLGHHTLGGLLLLPSRIDTLAVGALIAIVARRPGGLERIRRYVPAVGTACIIGFLLVWKANSGPANYGPRMQRYGFTVIAFGYAALLVWTLTASRESRTVRFLSGRVLRWIGARSYAIYVWHPIAIRGLSFLQVPQRTVIGNLPLPLRQPTMLVLVLCGSAVMAELSWRLIESPFLSLKRYVPRPPGGADRAASLRALGASSADAELPAELARTNV